MSNEKYNTLAFDFGASSGRAHRLRAMTALNKPVKNLLFFFMPIPLFICLWFVFMVCIVEQLTCPSPYLVVTE